ncbi:MAG TPA: DUF881 domain-containing protein [Candidatus Limnocylindria bacterium]|nr:DUF881 domain-containing protein [Candidatus Limnocylindria bacterium]
MATRFAQLSLFAVAVLIGALLVGQLRSQARPIELANLTPQELSTLIETLSARNSELRDGLADLRDQISDYERAAAEGQSSLAIGQEDLLRVRAFGGLGAVEGQGIVVEGEGSFDPTSVNDIIQELRNAGADAIAIDDIRITARSVAVLGTSAIEIDGVPIGRAFTVTAIGSPGGLTTAMTREGGLLQLLEQSIQARFTIREDRSLVVPATERDLTPTAARPVE